MYNSFLLVLSHRNRCISTTEYYGDVRWCRFTSKNSKKCTCTCTRISVLVQDYPKKSAQPFFFLEVSRSWKWTIGRYEAIRYTLRNRYTHLTPYSVRLFWCQIKCYLSIQSLMRFFLSIFEEALHWCILIVCSRLALPLNVYIIELFLVRILIQV